MESSMGRTASSSSAGGGACGWTGGAGGPVGGASEAGEKSCWTSVRSRRSTVRVYQQIAMGASPAERGGEKWSRRRHDADFDMGDIPIRAHHRVRAGKLIAAVHDAVGSDRFGGSIADGFRRTPRGDFEMVGTPFAAGIVLIAERRAFCRRDTGGKREVGEVAPLAGVGEQIAIAVPQRKRAHGGTEAAELIGQFSGN